MHARQEYAAHTRCALIEENIDLYNQDNGYMVRIVGKDTTGKQKLEDFIIWDPRIYS